MLAARNTPVVSTGSRGGGKTASQKLSQYQRLQLEAVAARISSNMSDKDAGDLRRWLRRIARTF
jgi:hypothetical protein